MFALDLGRAIAYSTTDHSKPLHHIGRPSSAFVARELIRKL